MSVAVLWLKNEPSQLQFSTSAPGKAVLWGEYAVLDDASAVAAAVNHEAHCTFNVAPKHNTEVWEVESRGFSSPSTRWSLEQLLAGHPKSGSNAHLLSCVIRQLPNTERLPTAAHLLLNTDAFYHEGHKLGFGSSAALCVALFRGLCQLTHSRAHYEPALAAHRHAQGVQGSGIDVAVAWQQTSVLFKAGRVTPFKLPKTLQYRFIWTGKSAKTAGFLSKFADWRASNPAELYALGQASELLCEHPNLAHLADYTTCLNALDQAANLGIISGGHESLTDLAKTYELVYKPCGAGGGDIGVAFANDKLTLDDFCAEAHLAGFESLATTQVIDGR